jgi:hypothetical protein
VFEAATLSQSALSRAVTKRVCLLKPKRSTQSSLGTTMIVVTRSCGIAL